MLTFLSTPLGCTSSAVEADGLCSRAARPSPEGRSSLIHVEDLARLLVALAPVNPVTRGQTYEPWDDNPFGYEHRELAKMIGAALGKDTIIAAPLPPAVMQLGAQIDRLLRGSKAKLTPDRVGYMLHPDWVCDMKKAPPLSLWQAVWGGAETVTLVCCRASRPCIASCTGCAARTASGRRTETCAADL